MDEFALEYDDDLLRELLEDDSLFHLPAISCGSESEPATQSDGIITSRIFSGPTIDDIQNALSVFERKPFVGKWSTCTTSSAGAAPAGFQSTLSFLGKRLLEKNKMQDKYTVTLKCSESGTIEDGYKWRKYGQKTIKNSPHPRSYYRCTNTQCSAKRLVERSTQDPDVFVVTYEDLHLHHPYPLLPSNHGSVETATQPITRSRLDHNYKFGHQLEEPNVFVQNDNIKCLDHPESSVGVLEDAVSMNTMNEIDYGSYGMMNFSSSPSSSLPSSPSLASSPFMLSSPLPSSSCSYSPSNSLFYDTRYDMSMF